MSRLFLMLAAGLMCFTARAEAANPDSFNVCLKKLYFKSDKVDYYKTSGYLSTGAQLNKAFKSDYYDGKVRYLVLPNPKEKGKDLIMKPFDDDASLSSMNASTFIRVVDQLDHRWWVKKNHGQCADNPAAKK